MDAATKVLKRLILCGPDGPSGVFTIVTGHDHGITAALTGDNAGVVAAAAGIWGSLNGGIIGFVEGGPVGAFFGSISGFPASEAATAAVKLSKTVVAPPADKPASATHDPTFQVEVDQGFLGKFERSPKLTRGYTALNNHSFFGTQDNRLYWFYETKRYPVGFDELTPDAIYVVHSMAHEGLAKSSFTLHADGTLREHNKKNNEKWTWKPVPVVE